ncbi:MAG: hypothetical protein JST93_36990 [Acidobacteria bacterium]|nr:hypothetical protein [Acidobacteriota bacterium]
MPPHSYLIEDLVSTSEMKMAWPRQQETPAQASQPAKRKYDPLNPFADWPEEVLFIINRYPEIRLAMMEALDIEIKRGTFF